MADVVCAKTVKDIAVRYRVLRYGTCVVCENCNRNSGQIYGSEV
jgi:hypothetical protein